LKKRKKCGILKTQKCGFTSLIINAPPFKGAGLYFLRRKSEGKKGCAAGCGNVVNP
jgi:hypothetical protein